MPQSTLNILKNMLASSILLGTSVLGFAGEDDQNLQVKGDIQIDESTSVATMLVSNVTRFDLGCDYDVKGTIRGYDSQSGEELTILRLSETIDWRDENGKFKAKEERLIHFDFAREVLAMRKTWKDPSAVLIKVDPITLISRCSP